MRWLSVWLMGLLLNGCQSWPLAPAPECPPATAPTSDASGLHPHLQAGWQALAHEDSAAMRRWLQRPAPGDLAPPEAQLYPSLQMAVRAWLKRDTEHQKLARQNARLRAQVKRYQSAIDALTRIEQDLSKDSP
ncbi:MAG: hypothetical protein D6758_02250 [Gammaproteobacteria bacterium]|nr:MAG: hypothetical protein D6758_02250 [Gammaproteobacteria bacterium]